jgi:hypothetical protein
MDSRPVLIAVGGGASNVVEHILAQPAHRELAERARLYVANTDYLSLSRTSPQAKILRLPTRGLGEGLGAGGNSDVGRSAAELGRTALQAAIGTASLVIVVACLGGGTGSGAAPYVAELARNAGARVVIVATTPFEFEGRRNRVAQRAAEGLRKAASAMCLFPNSMLLMDIDPDDITYEQAFFAGNECVIAAISRVLFPGQQNQRLRTALLEIGGSADWSPILSLFGEWEQQLSGEPLSRHRPSIITPRTEGELIALVNNPYQIHTVAPKRFEELIYAAYRLAGLRVELMGRSSDDGVDMMVWTPGSLFGNDFLTVVQVKRYTGKRRVGSPVIRDLSGAQALFDAQRAECITTTSFTQSARVTAQKLDIDLVEFSELCAKVREIIKPKIAGP